MKVGRENKRLFVFRSAIEFEESNVWDKVTKLNAVFLCVECKLCGYMVEMPIKDIIITISECGCKIAGFYEDFVVVVWHNRFLLVLLNSFRYQQTMFVQSTITISIFFGILVLLFSCSSFL